jgi:hypothetical protein
MTRSDEPSQDLTLAISQTEGQRFAELHARQKSSTYYATGYNVIAKYSRISLFLWAPGLLLQAICIVLMDRMAINALGQNSFPSPLLAVGLEGGILVGNILLIIGLSYYARAKGYTAYLGLVGVLSCLGLVILALLPDRTKSTPK